MLQTYRTYVTDEFNLKGLMGTNRANTVNLVDLRQFARIGPFVWQITKCYL